MDDEATMVRDREGENVSYLGDATSDDDVDRHGEPHQSLDGRSNGGLRVGEASAGHVAEKARRRLTSPVRAAPREGVACQAVWPRGEGERLHNDENKQG
jgi:hypothetical protein